MNLTGVIATVLGLTAGILSAIVFSKYQAIGGHKPSSTQPKIHALPTTTGSQCIYFTFPHETRKVSQGKTPAKSLEEAVNRDSKLGLFDPRLNSTFLHDKVKILCFVILQRGQIGNYGKAAKATWTKHCNKVLFLSNENNPDVGTIDIKLPEGKSQIWQRSKLGLQYLYENLVDGEYDWFVKASHDSILVPENLRYLLFMHKANIPDYIAHMFTGPNSGGAVFALSKQALALIGPTLQDYKPSFGGVSDDLELGECLKASGAVSGHQGVDSEGVQRFRMIVPDHKLPLNTKGYTAWYWQYIRHPEKEGPECCSDYSISFHYISPNNMYLLEYMIYHMRPFGVGHYTCPANMDAIMSKVLPANGQQDRLSKVGEVAGQVGLTNNEVGGHDKVVGGQVRSGIQEGEAGNLMN